ncbi:MAG: competence/damage-inducible protein A [Chloroflexi bacterium]|jgi:nicotinamide-nucleotide amidase|nr:competence/damage-inducible protein A [Chloroflexota bacterium]MBT7081729.1 competence/damage-inducible protein A [Chloroflexota bacterium]MBT7290750.1 competence/damage-inducible protein A [Chloroflexota bacterium]
MKAEIISIGTELLLGEIPDTNASYLASQLPLLGIDLNWVSQVGDNHARLVEVLRRAWDRSDLIITGGGLGPTEDDITREVVAELLGEEMILDQTLVSEMEQMFLKRGWKMPERNLKQAMVTSSVTSVPNPYGTAPGWWVEKDGRMLVTLPGPPRELHRMWTQEIAPRLRKKSTSILVSRVFKLLTLGEATVDEMASPLLSSTNPTIGVYAKFDGIHLRLAAKAANEQAALDLMAPFEQQLRDIFGTNIWGTDDDTLESAVGGMLTEKGLSLATMESCTGGLLASTITDAPGSSAYFKGGLVTYATQSKIDSGVDPAVIEKHGVISAETALAMATAARDRFGADIGIGVTGVAGPDGLDGKDAGTVHIGIDYQGSKKNVFINLPPRRIEVKRRAVLLALAELRKLLIA